MNSADSTYVLGHSTAEHERLIRQGRSLQACTGRLFREAGIGSGQYVLDLGSGVGDVALIVASLVGPTGQVIGIDRDTRALERARERASALGHANVQFEVADLAAPPDGPLYDAIVGRFVLMFQPDPVAILRALEPNLRPGGVLILQEPSWASFFALTSQLPLRAACGQLVCAALRSGGANPDMPVVLQRGFQAIGLPAPTMRIETLIAREPEDRQWLHELLLTLEPRLPATGPLRDAVGHWQTLGDRLELELREQQACAPLVGMVGAWSRKVRQDGDQDISRLRSHFRLKTGTRTR
jgi:SAM-dependent methyltransferase